MKTLWNVLKTIFAIILLIILAVNIWIMIQTKLHPNKVPSVFGYKPFIVASGSMESELEIGDLVFVKMVDAKELKVNDIIAFRDPKNFVTTHRIVKEVQDGSQRCFRTKGDNNNAEDVLMVCPEQIEGKYIKKFSRVGYVILFIQKPLGFTVLMLTITIICLLIYFSSTEEKNKISEEELKEFEEYKKEKIKKLEKEKKNKKK